jgi:hypothetical protein
LLLVVSHQGRGDIDCVTGNRLARDEEETGSWFDASRPAVQGIGPLAGQWIEVAGLSGGHLPTETTDGWLARRADQGVLLSGPMGTRMLVPETEEIRVFGFSPDGAALVVGSSPSLTIVWR